MKVLYITFIDFKESRSGSSVRPQRMREAFLSLGYELKLVSGNDMFRKGKEERIASIKDAIKWLEDNRPDYCYVENSTSPVKLFLNWKLLSIVHRKGIPIGYYYRDFYYKFPVSLGHGLIKDIFYRFLYARDEILLNRCADILYLPSEQCFRFFRHKRKKRLPPGVEIQAPAWNREDKRACIYVGGINNSYGLYMLIDAFELVNKFYNDGREIKLKLICRESDFSLLPETYINYLRKLKWLEIFHAESDVGLIPILDSFYSKQVIPIKISDYLSNGLPVISTPLEAEIDFFGGSKACLFSRDDSAEEFSKTIIDFFEDIETRKISRDAVLEFSNRNTWIERIHQLEDDLIE